MILNVFDVYNTAWYVNLNYCQFSSLVRFVFLAAQEGFEDFGQSAAEDPEEEGRVRRWKGQEEGKSIKSEILPPS